MKKIFNILSVVTILVCLFLLYGVLVNDANNRNTYTVRGVVVCDFNGWIMVKDVNGNCWEFDDETLKIDDKVELVMYNSCSPYDVTDDVIKNFKKIG